MDDWLVLIFVESLSNVSRSRFQCARLHCPLVDFYKSYMFYMFCSMIAEYNNSVIMGFTI